MEIKTINVLVICYNQEKLIGKTLDSIIMQREWGLNQIIVGDDCSTDGTWRILQDYQRKYPNIIKPLRQAHNKGIYGNMETVKNNRGVADLYLHCSGDDPLLDGFFQKVQKFIYDNCIDTSDAIGIYSDWKTIAPDGKESVHKQDVILTGYAPWSLYIHGMLSSRSLLVSEKVMSRFEPIILDRGLNLAECMYDSQAHINIDKAYYMPVVTSIYYSRIGVSSKLSKTDYYTKQSIIKYEYILDHYAKEPKDISSVKYGITKSSFLIRPRIKKIVQLFYYYEKSMLPGLREPMSKTLRLFGSYFKYYLTCCRKK